MNILNKAIITVFLITFSMAGSAYSTDLNEKWLPEKSEDAPAISLSTSFLTKYVWRGWNLGNEPVMQTDSSISWKGLTFGLWTNYSMNNDKTTDGGRYQEFTEIDYNADYTFNFGETGGMMGMEVPEVLGPLSMSIGYIYYTFPNVDRDDKYFDSHEVYAGVSYDVFPQPSFTWYWDVGHGKGNPDGGGHGSYFAAGIGHTFGLGGEITADLGMTIGYNDEQWTNKSGWGDMAFSGGVNMPVFGYFTITPSMSYSLILDRGTFGDASENEFYGGITIGFGY